jgi:hypothetical protein
MRLVFAVCLLLVTGCAPTADSCGPANCQGCCDWEGACQSGFEQKVCGRFGQSCDQCVSPQSCIFGTCGVVAPVDADGGSRDAGVSGGTDGGSGGPTCRTTLPSSQTLSQPCCPDWGRDACGALLFCAALDGRTQATCYPERSRLDQTTCPRDEACVSGSCNPQAGLCRSSIGAGCSQAVGCAPAATGAAGFCDTTTTPATCQAVGDGTLASPCAAAADCRSLICEGNRCKSPPGGSCVIAAECGGPGAVCNVRTCNASCSGLDCSNGNGSLSSSLCRSGQVLLPVPCPSQAPTGLTCPVTSYRADRTAIAVTFTWSSPVTAQGSELTCTGPTGFSLVFPAQHPGSSRVATLEPVSQGRTYGCTLATLTQVGPAWVRSPLSSPCTVVAP